jgi:hypothetical protein
MMARVVVGLRFSHITAFAVNDVAGAQAFVGRFAGFGVEVAHGQAELVHDERYGLVRVEGDLAVGALTVIHIAPAVAEAHDALGQRVGVAERPAGHVVLMRPLVADVAAAVGPLPVPVVVELFPHDGQFGPWGGPELVIHRGGWLLRAIHVVDAQAQTVNERVGELGFADVAFFDPLHGAGPAFVGPALHAVLHDEALRGGFGGRGHELGAFDEVVAHRLLDIDMLAVLQGGERDQDVAVIRCGDGDGIDVFVSAALAEIAVGLHLDALLVEIGDLLVHHGGIDIAQCHEAHPGNFEQFFDVTAATTAKSDDGDTHIAIRTERCGPGRQ